MRGAVSQAVYPLTKSQEGMWVDYQVKPLGTKYNLTLEWDLRARDGPLPAVSDIVDGKLLPAKMSQESRRTTLKGREKYSNQRIDDKTCCSSL